MNKIFVVAGETSGDLVGGWFFRDKAHKIFSKDISLEGVGGDALQACGMRLYRSYAELNVVGLVEIIKRLPAIFRVMHELVDYICAKNFTHVVLIDFPGFNLRLAQRLKQRNPSLKIIYLSPPQLWCWGQWKLKTLRTICDEIIVLYPFEVAWYRKHGVRVRYLGNPVFERLLPVISQQKNPVFRLGIFPGSRRQEVELFVPILSAVIAALIKLQPTLEICVFKAPHIDEVMLKPLMDVAPDQVRFVQSQDRIQYMQSCAVALSKAGTVTLELGLLGIPTIIYYKAHWLTYFIAKKLVSIDKMGLPNIIMQHDVMPEFIQHECTTTNLVRALQKLFDLWLKDSSTYEQECQKFQELRDLFAQSE
ncbi:lipid-A-disaccharide synthase [Candidatus Dependentiae bacterium]|nr:lipid-A-disaccharide synthase [Candidatus Dependentiae bacterium]